MKTGINSLFSARWMLFFCLVLSGMAARCQAFGGIVAYAGMDFNGNNVTIDSFDSSDPNHSIWQTNMTYRGINYGVYSDTLSYVSNSFPSRTADAVVATDGNILNVGNAQIYGYVDTAPGGVVDINVNGSVGDLDWVYNGDSGIEQGHVLDDMNQEFFSKGLPNPAANGWQTTWTNVPSPPSGTVINIGGTWTNISGAWTYVGGTSYTNTGTGFNIGGVVYPLVITNRPANTTNFVYYSMPGLIQSLYVDAPRVVLYLTNGVDYGGINTFTINTNADVQIYTTGNFDIGIRGVVNNLNQYAHAFTIYDVYGYTNLSFTFTGNFGPAYIYVPSSSIAFAGGGSATYGFIGSIFCNSISVNGHYSLHFDGSLNAPFFPASINQQPANQIVQVGANATFTIDATGYQPGYQWYFNQTNLILGAVNPSLTVTNVQPTDAGLYTVVITNYANSVTSSPASLTVYTNAAATLCGVFNPTNEQFQFKVTGVTGLNYVVECSTNLVDWVPLWTNAAPFSFTDTNMDAYPQRFYRSVFVP